MTHKMRLADSPFEMIKNGEKTVELRLYDEKRRALSVGDVICFERMGEGCESLTVKVVALHVYHSFEELYRSLPLLSCGYLECEIESASYTDMYEYYTSDEEKKWGVVGIEIEIIPNIC